MRRRLVLGHRGHGVPTFPFTCQLHPEAPQVVTISPAWASALPPSETSLRIKCYSGWCYFGSTCCLAGQCYFWLIYIFPYVSKGGRIAAMKFCICFPQTSSTVDTSENRALGLGQSCSQSSPPLPPPCTTVSCSVTLPWGDIFLATLHVKNASAN